MCALTDSVFMMLLQADIKSNRSRVTHAEATNTEAVVRDSNAEMR